MSLMLFRKKKLLSLAISISCITPSFYLLAEDKKSDLGHIQISENNEESRKDKQGYAQVYEKDVSNIYLGKELLERYQGVSPADLLKSAIGVYSGEARNGGALDPNIRGIQGQGRIPVTVDGTEQAITVYRGYSGASNRNYIDSNLISSIYIEKGPSLTPDMKTGIGGGIAVKTLDIRDIVPIGDSFGINFKGDISNNSTRYKEVYTNMIEDYRYYPKFYQQNAYLIDPALEITPQKSKVQNFQDYSFRLGIGFEEENFNLLFAYALREKGNYFAGKRNAKNYSETDRDLLESVHVKDGARNFEPYLPFIAHIYRPNNEVPNTSNRSHSILVKGILFPESMHRLSINYRYTDLLFGDIMPSRLSWVRYDKNLVNQWPLGNITQQSGILNYQYKPEDKKTDLLLRLWGNLTAGHTNTRGGKPREPKQVDSFANKNTKWDLSYETGFIDTSSLYQENNRYGFDLSSMFKLSPQFSISFSSNYQFEKLDSDEIDVPEGLDFVTAGRAGQRHEINLSLSTDWKPLSWLAITAGGKYHYYHLTDTFLNNKRRNKIKGYEKSSSIRGYIVSYKRTLTHEECYLVGTLCGITKQQLPEKYKSVMGDPVLGKKRREVQEYRLTHPDYEKLPDNIKKEINRIIKTSKQVHFENRTYLRDKNENIFFNSTTMIPMKTELLYWGFDKNGELLKSNNILLNGYLNMNEKVVHPITGDSVNKYEMGVTKPIPIYLDDDNKDSFAPEPSYQHGAFSPLVSATVYADDILRFYGRYTEQLRLPNLFEDTSGFSGSKARYYGFKLKPERAKSTELGVVFDLTDWLNIERHADIKINYFYTNIENVFDRDTNWQIRQFEKQKLEGLEVQARFDNGFIFMDTALVYSHKNKVCDKNAFSNYDPSGLLGIKKCMTGGYPGGFLRTSIQPKYSVNLHLGTRWLDNKLEVGSRWLYSSEVENKDEKWLKEKLPREMYGQNNNPMRWAKVFTVDAYLNYQYSENLSFEIVGSNLLNEYYIDPLTRSGMPAPGRTIKLGVTAQF